MMDQEVLQSYDVDLEDGEISDSTDDGYTPLQRPPALNTNTTAASMLTAKQNTNTGDCIDSPLATCHRMQEALEEEEESQTDSETTSSGELSDVCLKKTPGNTADRQRRRRKRVRRTVMVRVQPTNESEAQEKRARFKKYNIWTAALQEDALTENMRGCDVTRSNDRNVENYDFSFNRRINGGNSLKRRLSNSTDDLSDGGDTVPAAKRGRTSNNRDGNSVKSRLGQRARGVRGRRDSSPTSGSDNSYEPRHILDLNDPVGREPTDVAREIANKLYEDKDELLVRVVELLGLELPIEIYKETQRIEADGGMMIKNGKRRRTPGGVFLFLLKHHEKLTAQVQKSIFSEERQTSHKRHKSLKSRSRDRKVEELKKRLSQQEKELPALSTRKDHFLLGSDLGPENQAGNLSNPPPSPVGQEHSPEYKTHAINHVAPDASPEKPSTSASALAALVTTTTSAVVSPSKNLISYDDDFLDVNCTEMDFF